MRISNHRFETDDAYLESSAAIAQIIMEAVSHWYEIGLEIKSLGSRLGSVDVNLLKLHVRLLVHMAETSEYLNQCANAVTQIQKLGLSEKDFLGIELTLAEELLKCHRAGDIDTEEIVRICDFRRKFIGRRPTIFRALSTRRDNLEKLRGLINVAN